MIKGKSMREGRTFVNSFRLLFPFLAVLVAASSGSGFQGEEYDLVIRGGRVLDGAGNPWIAADVAIHDGRFVAIGHIDGKGRTELDATGKYVSPGWIDMMDQSGRVLPQNGLAENKLRMGVTTAIGGEGGTPVLASEVAHYFRDLTTSGISMNFGSYFSATQARVAVMGRIDGEPTEEQLESMRAIVDTAMRAGAMGLTTALIYPPPRHQLSARLAKTRNGLLPKAGNHP